MTVYLVRMIVGMASSAPTRSGRQQPRLTVVRADDDAVRATYGVRLVSYAELRLITGYSADVYRRAAAAGHITRYGPVSRPRFELGEVLDWLAAPRPRATRAELTGEGPRLARLGRVPFAA